MPGYLVAVSVSSTHSAARALLRRGAVGGSSRTCKVLPVIWMSPERVNASRNNQASAHRGREPKWQRIAGFSRLIKLPKSLLIEVGVRECAESCHV